MAQMAVDEAALDAFLATPDVPAAEAPVAAAPAAAPAAPAETAPVTEAAIPAATPAADAAVDAAVAATGQSEEKWDPQTRKYIEDLRDESAKYRKRGQRYNEVFDGYEDDAVSEWLDLANTLKNDPKAAAERFQTIAQAILEANAEPEAPAVDPNAEPEVLTRADFDRLMAEREKQADLARRVTQIEADAKGLGYTPGSDDYQELLWIASSLPSGSVQDAHTKMQAKYQAFFDKKVAEMGGAPAPVVPAQGAPASGERQIKTFEQANEALDAYLAGLSW
jgi:hypothetical protein